MCNSFLLTGAAFVSLLSTRFLSFLFHFFLFPRALFCPSIFAASRGRQDVTGGEGVAWRSTSKEVLGKCDGGLWVMMSARMEAIALRLEAIALRLEAFALRLEAIASRFGGHRYSRLEAFALRLEAIASRFGGHR